MSRQRRALTNLGGDIATEGDRAEADALANALSVAPALEAEDAARAHVHGFHTYPARLHPDTAARLVSAFAPPGGRVLDPFCGSGTVLVEALVQGRQPFGTDLNPLAVRLARCKTRPRAEAELAALSAGARQLADQADARRKARAGASRRFIAEDMELFEPHVLLELDSLRGGIAALPESPLRADLWLVLSAILGKFSRQRGDTSGQREQRRTAPGFAARFFTQKADDLAARLGEMTRLCSANPLPAVIEQDDATDLRTLPAGPVAALITSPPYAATYDYVAHHALRLRWLGLDAKRLARGEIGARTTYQRLGPADARLTWGQELTRFFHAAGRLLPRGGALVLVVADSSVGTVALRADEIVAEVGRACGFRPAARASQDRPHFHGPTQAAFKKRPRAEHALLLRKAQ